MTKSPLRLPVDGDLLCRLLVEDDAGTIARKVGVGYFAALRHPLVTIGFVS
jgi:hypothetical protein